MEILAEDESNVRDVGHSYEPTIGLETRMASEDFSRAPSRPIRQRPGRSGCSSEGLDATPDDSIALSKDNLCTKSARVD